MNHDKNEHDLEDSKSTKRPKKWKGLLEKRKFKAVLVLIAIIIIIFITVLIFLLSRKESLKLNSLKQDKIRNPTTKETIGILSIYKTTTSSQLAKKKLETTIESITTSPNLINASLFIPNLTTQASIKHTLPFITIAVSQTIGTFKNETKNTVSNGNDKYKVEISSRKVPEIKTNETIIENLEILLMVTEPKLEMPSSTKTALIEITTIPNIDIETKLATSEAYHNEKTVLLSNTTIETSTAKATESLFNSINLTVTTTVANIENEIKVSIGEAISNKFSNETSTTIKTTTSVLTIPDISTTTGTLKTALQSQDLEINEQKFMIKTTKKAILKKMNPDKAYLNKKIISKLKSTTATQSISEIIELQLEPVDLYSQDLIENVKDLKESKPLEAIDLGQFDYNISTM